MMRILLIILIAGFAYFAWKEVKTSSDHIFWVNPDLENSIPFLKVFFSASDFDGSRNILAGDVAVSYKGREDLYRPERRHRWVQEFATGKSFVQLGSVIDDSGAYSIENTGLSNLIDMNLVVNRPTTPTYQGRGTFEFVLKERVSSFYYPFDSYLFEPKVAVFAVNSDLVYSQAYKPERWDMRFNLNELVMLGRSMGWAERSSFELVRPVSLRAATVVFILTFVFWLVFVVTKAPVESLTGQLVSYFVSIWGLRAVFGNAELFPSLIDYMTTGLGLCMVSIILLRWYVKEEGPRCQECRETIAVGATRCRSCGQSVISPTKDQKGRNL